MPRQSHDSLLRGLLRDVSRSFYLSLRILPRDLRAPVGLAYLLARAADTVADTRLIARDARLAHLETLRRAFAGTPVDVAGAIAACRPHQGKAAEATLLTRLPEAVAELERLDAPDRAAVRGVLATLTSGMVFDLATFPGEDAAHVTALGTRADLDRYVYLVAGCVGEFWTVIHAAHRPRLARWDVAAMSTNGVRFGKALQMTNVLRDVPSDLRQGRCYLPADELAAHGLAPADLLDPSAMPKLRPLYEALLELADAHYHAGWRYTLAIPRREWRMRLACAWPLLIGEATLAMLRRHDNPLAATTPVKIPRARVRALLTHSIAAVWSNRALAAEATRARGAPAR
ncbi:MAG: squalene/phytoene synthase family protein [Candidatus Rokubacteria bacterium]|nr:squalene/phytoene synthase family protein [Candidatus Rokubacteria bacterium]